MMNSIPDELLLNVFQFLSRNTIEQCQLVCRNFVELTKKFAEILALRLVQEIWITNEGDAPLYFEDCRQGWDVADEKIKRALNFAKINYLAIIIKNGTCALEFLKKYFDRPGLRLLIHECQIYYAADDGRYFPELMTFFGGYLIPEKIILSFATYMPFNAVVEHPEILNYYRVDEGLNKLNVSENEEPIEELTSSSSKKASTNRPVLERLEIGTLGAYGIEFLNLGQFFGTENLPFSKKELLIFHRLHPRHVRFFFDVVDRFRTIDDPSLLFKRISFSMLNQPNLDEFFTGIGLKKSEEVNKFEEVRKDGWRLKIYLRSLIEFVVMPSSPPGVQM